MLSDSEIKKAITDGHFINDDGKRVAYRLDADRLGLQIKPSGTACWLFRFTSPATGKPSMLSLGTYPATGLKAARDKAHDARKQLDAGHDPVVARKAVKAAARARLTFAEVMAEWFAAFRLADLSRSPKTRASDLCKRDQLVALFGKMFIDTITPSDIQQALIKIAIADGHKTKARYLRGMLSDVFTYAVPNKYCASNPAALGLFNLPKTTKAKLPAILAPVLVGELMRDIAAYDGRVLVRAALEIMARTFPRPSNVAQMEWAEIVGDVWIIPAHKMKMRRIHRVPLSRQVLAILDSIRPLTGAGRYVFAFGDRPMVAKTINRALRSLGYSGDEAVAHGFRSTASTLLNRECRWPADIIELQLAHGNEDKVAATYNRAFELDALMTPGADSTDKLWAMRAQMMQHWADKLDALRDAGANVVPFKAVAA
jgi:integrase